MLDIRNNLLICLLFISFISFIYHISDENDVLYSEISDVHPKIITDLFNIYIHALDTYRITRRNVIPNNRPVISYALIEQEERWSYICPSNIICEIDKRVIGFDDDMIDRFVSLSKVSYREVELRIIKEYRSISSMPTKEDAEMLRQAMVSLRGIKYGSDIYNLISEYGEGRCIEMASYSSIDLLSKYWNNNECIDIMSIQITFSHDAHSFLILGDIPTYINSFKDLTFDQSSNMILLDPWEGVLMSVSDVIKFNIPLYTTKYILKMEKTWEFRCSSFDKLKSFDTEYGTKFFDYIIREFDKAMS